MPNIDKVRVNNVDYNISGTGSSGGETLPVGTEVDFDGQASDIPVGWEQVDEQPAYSTNETVCGTWIDGKPLYRIVINTTSPSNEIGTLYNTSSLNIDNIINMYCVISASSGSTRLKVKLPYYFADNDAGTIWLEGDNINLRLTSSTYRGQSTILFLEYTKTTDTAGGGN